MGSRTLKWNSVAALRSDAELAAYIEAALEDEDTTFVAHALGVAARARGMTQVAQDAGLSRENLCKALSLEGNPSFDTIMRVLRALHLDLHVSPAE